MVDLARNAFSALGEVGINTLFVCTYAPLAFYGKDQRVQSAMLEIRRETFLTAGRPAQGFEPKTAAIPDLLDALSLKSDEGGSER